METKFGSVVVTGGNGSGGSFLIDHILSRDSECTIFVPRRWRSSPPKSKRVNSERVKFIECDLTDLSSTIRFLELAQPQFIFHLAAHANVRASFDVPIHVFENNTKGTQNLLEGLRLIDAKPRLLMASTSEVYGNPASEDLPITERQTLSPVSPYAASKVAQEMLARSYFHSYGIPIIITRMFTYLNPRREDLFATTFAIQAIAIAKGLAKEIRHGNLKSIRTILDVRDASEAYWLAMHNCISGEVYNIAGSRVISVGEFLSKLTEKLKIEPTLIEDLELLRPVDVTLQVPSSAKFREATGWKERFTLDESIDFLIQELSR